MCKQKKAKDIFFSLQNEQMKVIAVVRGDNLENRIQEALNDEYDTEVSFTMPDELIDIFQSGCLYNEVEFQCEADSITETIFVNQTYLY